ncbi:Hypothetical protein CAP_6913 [Chondromyces apiculatus DSM 436]|uniref:Myrcene/ocimene synthase n=2 Tax=Chondromyces apiculatus TaxID=51 RepID=A0A017TGZ0_9BACT|nr:Hypothetical protein CAP_6913 [Chondromyces apiculatus DSM 436]
MDNKDIECDSREEATLDLQAVFNSFLQSEREATEKAKEVLQSRGLPQGEFSRIRRMLAEQKGIKVGEDMLDHLLDQLIEMLLHSSNIEEVFGEDHDLRRRMRPILRKYLEIDDTLDAEVRSKLRHVQEGTRTWEVEYRRVMDDIQRRKGLV